MASSSLCAMITILPSGAVIERRAGRCSQASHRAGAARGSRFNSFLFLQCGEDAVGRPFLKLHLLCDEIHVSEEPGERCAILVSDDLGHILVRTHAIKRLAKSLEEPCDFGSR